MKYIKTSLSIVAATIMMASCETQKVETIDLTALEQGGYIRTVSPVVNSTPVNSFNISKTNMSGTKMEIVAEAITPDKGALFASYDLVVKFVDATPANGTKTTANVVLKSIPASAFTKDATTGYPRLNLIITGAEALAATKLVDADISVGDRFEVTGTMKLTNGKSFTITNTGVNITGGAFYGSPFFYRLVLI